jgi:predicted ATP-grasp superfamily ATP-dependent carboligase
MGRGGTIAPVSRLDEGELVVAGGTVARLSWQPQHLEQVRDLAVRAVQAVGPLALAGVDIKLDLREGTLAPTVLDLNPRPAGLLHANLLTTGEPGLGAGLWRLLGGSPQRA